MRWKMSIFWLHLDNVAAGKVYKKIFWTILHTLKSAFFCGMIHATRKV